MITVRLAQGRSLRRAGAGLGRSALLAALLAAAAGCAGSGPRPGAGSGDGASGAGAAPASGGAVSARTERLFEDAVQAVEDQKKLQVPTDWALLERKWRAVLDSGDLAEAHYNLGVALEAQGRLPEARDAYRRALARKPGLRQAAVNLGVLLEKEGNASAAAEAYAAVVRDFPDDAAARARLAALYRASGQLEDAWRLAREALLRDPNALGAYKVMIRVALARNQLDLARLIALRAAKIAPSDADLAFFGAIALEQGGDEAGATAGYRRALQLDPDLVAARQALLALAVKNQSWGGVAEHAKAILAKAPENGPAHLALGIAQRHLGQADAALASYAKAEQLAGGRLPEVHLARAVLFMRVKNDCEPAIEEFRAYQRSAGPAAGNPVVFRLQRECEEILVANRQAAEAAKQMQLEAERQAAEEAAKKSAGAKGAASQESAPVPTSAPAR
ncbi:MAG TPA: adventurous gliding motility TPR repeat lipoprotein GltE [Anaeromyxobacteraceae bacterium]|nr:adventurous gliding motility TPR repeat lipoprotein GltE [Anaeromyxobacteraceae bacterium]